MALHVDELTVRYGDTTAVDTVSFDLPTGSVLGLVGPSGCGKSTLLRTVAGLVAPAGGDVRWAGASLNSVPTHARGFGLMFQDHALFTHRSVADNIGFGLKMAGAPSEVRANRVEELLVLVGLEGFNTRPIEGLSGGEAQRVALARALAPEPKLLLLDEPLASLDRARRVELNAELARLLRELNQTAIYVTHDQDEAFGVADQIGVMHQGELLRLGTPSEVWRDPQSEIVARFVGHEAITEIDGQRFAVRPDALAIVEAPVERSAQSIEGVVGSCTFQGDRFEVSLLIDGATWRLFHTEMLAPGATVTIDVNRDRLAKLRS